ncbi:hypothetical protein HY633_01490 [Candidatus Uhrbacteria bacterium]|nr:hypothetical protein [Candidatus Uhrbacteria bacterium]
MDCKVIGIYTFVPTKGSYEQVVTARLIGDGIVVLEGNEIICNRLRADGVIELGGRRVMPEDGKRFLEVLPEVFRNPYLKAVPIFDESA